VTMGSGSLAAMAVFESRYKVDMTREEAMQLVREAICAGIFNDLGSGSNVDLCVITKGNVEYLRSEHTPNKKGVRQQDYKYPIGTTRVLETHVKPVVSLRLGTEVDRVLPMDVDS